MCVCMHVADVDQEERFLHVYKCGNTLASLCALCGVYRYCKHGWTNENVYGLIPIGSQHQHRRRCPDHVSLRADWLFPGKLFLPNQIDEPPFTANYGPMKSHAGGQHI